MLADTTQIMHTADIMVNTLAHTHRMWRAIAMTLLMMLSMVNQMPIGTLTNKYRLRT